VAKFLTKFALYGLRKMAFFDAKIWLRSRESIKS